MDAASNNGVDDIRDLRDGAVYTPERGEYKIYIIDEVHMLSPSAFNALLKIMEEPPDYVKFILATTEIHKVPATIASRCQRYDFRRIKAEDIAKRLLYIASRENLKLTEDGAAMIAKLADGGMRDAVSLLDQCSACADEINAEAVSNTAGIAGKEYVYDLLEAVTECNAANALSITGALYDMSKDLMRLCEELITQLRNIMLLTASPETAEKLMVCTPDEISRLKKLAEKNSLERIMALLTSFQDCRERMNRVLNRRIEFEMSLIRICGNVDLPQVVDNSEIYDKIKMLEDKLAGVNTPPKKQEILTAESPAIDAEPTPNVDTTSMKPEEYTPCDRWEEVLEEFKRLNPAVAASLEGSTAATAGNVIIIQSKNRFFITLLKSSKENAISLGRAIYNVLGQKYAIRARCTTTEEEQKNMAEQLIKKAQSSGISTDVE